MKRFAAFSLLALFVATIYGSTAAGTDAAKQPAKPESLGREAAEAVPVKASPSAKYFTDVVLVNQDGEEMRFYSDLLKDKVVVINTIYTTCSGVCPVMGKSFLQFQEHLGDRLGRDVHLISISQDPENDTPPKLKEFGEKYGMRPGWYLLTGKKENVDFALSKLGQWVEQKNDHSPIMLMGNDRTGLWKKAMGLSSPEELITVLDSVLLDEGGDLTGGGRPGN